jgi:TetR/AcrR family transcriptional repressor of nem operon
MVNTVPNSPKAARGRPREFQAADAIEAAKDLFWENGYQGSTLTDLEDATGLSRSSLYQAFGSKEALFALALSAYVDGFIAPRLAAMERPGAEPRDASDFFRALASLFRKDAVISRRGCLWVNALAEFSGRESKHEPRATEYRHRLRGAFANALSAPRGRGAPPSAVVVEQRSRMLAALVFGVWLTVRIDQVEAVRVCESAVAVIRSWGG